MHKKTETRMCINFGARLANLDHLGLISDPLIVSKFHNETHDPKGQENKIYTIVKGRETSIAAKQSQSPAVMKSNMFFKGILWKQTMHQRNETRVCIFSGPD